MLAPPNVSKGVRCRSPSPRLHRRRLSNYELKSDEEQQTKTQRWSEEVRLSESYVTKRDLYLAFRELVLSIFFRTIKKLQSQEDQTGKIV